MFRYFSNSTFLILSLLAISCTKQQTRRNPYLQEVRFSVSVNLSLPSYNNLTSIGNPVYINEAGVGTKGVFVMNVGFDQFRAFEARCSNHIPNSCSLLQVTGQSGICDCDELNYSLFTGQLLNRPSEGVYYDLLEYNTQLSGDVLRIYN